MFTAQPLRGAGLYIVDGIISPSINLYSKSSLDIHITACKELASEIGKSVSVISTTVAWGNRNLSTTPHSFSSEGYGQHSYTRSLIAKVLVPETVSALEFPGRVTPYLSVSEARDACRCVQSYMTLENVPPRDRYVFRI